MHCPGLARDVLDEYVLSNHLVLSAAIGTQRVSHRLYAATANLAAAVRNEYVLAGLGDVRLRYGAVNASMPGLGQLQLQGRVAELSLSGSLSSNPNSYDITRLRQMVIGSGFDFYEATPTGARACVRNDLKDSGTGKAAPDQQPPSKCPRVMNTDGSMGPCVSTWPFQAVITSARDFNTVMCSAVLIHRDWIVANAECIKSLDQTDVRMMIGEATPPSIEEWDVSPISIVYDDQGKLAVLQISVGNNDVDATVTPATLVDGDVVLTSAVPAYVSGWGTESTACGSGYRRTFQLRPAAAETCTVGGQKDYCVKDLDAGPCFGSVSELLVIKIKSLYRVVGVRQRQVTGSFKRSYVNLGRHFSWIAKTTASLVLPDHIAYVGKLDSTYVGGSVGVCVRIPSRKTAFRDLELLFLVDMSGSFGDDLTYMRATVANIATRISSTYVKLW